MMGPNEFWIYEETTHETEWKRELYNKRKVDRYCTTWSIFSLVNIEKQIVKNFVTASRVMYPKASQERGRE